MQGTKGQFIGGFLIKTFFLIFVLKFRHSQRIIEDTGKLDYSARSKNIILIEYTGAVVDLRSNHRLLKPKHLAPKHNHTSKIENKKCRRRHTFFLLLILLLSGDVERNPGPTTETIINNSQFPCNICTDEVTWNEDALQCEGCDDWIHRKCMCMSLEEYSRLGHLNITWICPKCGLLNLSLSLFISNSTENMSTLSRNSFEPLSPTSDSETSGLQSFASLDSPGVPLYTSSPTKTIPRRKHNRKSLSILNVNCQSIRNKKAMFTHMINRTNPDVIVGTESWLNANDNSSDYLPTEDYVFERRDRQTNTQGGGVFLGIKRDIFSERVKELETNCELLWCKLNLIGSKTLHIGAYYRPHESDEESLKELDVSLQRLGGKNENAILAGDFNFPSWDWKAKTLKPNCSHPLLHYRLGNMFDDYGMVQMVEEPTRERNTLDLFATTSPCKVNNVKIIPGISDHQCPVIEVDVSPIRRRQKPRNIRLYNKANWNSLRVEMESAATAIREMESTHTVQEMWMLFKITMLDAIDKHIPSKMCKKKDSLPYINKDIRRMVRKRDKVYDKMKNMQRDLDCSTDQYQALVEKFKLLKSTIQRCTRKAYWKYIEELITPDETNQYSGMKRFWAYIKQSRKDYTGVSTLKKDGITYTTPTDKANILNTQFQSVFTNESADAQDLPPPAGLYAPIGDINITEAGVHKLISNLKIHKASGPDDIGPRVLKEIVDVTAPILTSIFRKSYSTGILPDDWKSANVSPIYKKGSKSDAANYRPISLTCTSCKLMEHIVTSHIMKHARDQEILYDLQHGFRERRSCETQLLEFVSDITNNMKDGKQTDILIMDFSKAFDKVGHSKLTKKLDHYGVSGKTNNWIRGFLADRTQRVVVDGETSDEVAVTSGVPQGSVLGPSLFLYYINDMPEKTTHSRVRLFADDTIMYLAIVNDTDANHLQDDLDCLAQWEQTWQMEFHPEKCQVLTVTRKRTTQLHDYTLHGHILERVDEAKYLGVTLTKDLRWNRHTDSITTKANRSLAFLRRNLQINSPNLKTVAYQSIVRPSLEFSPSVWDPHTKESTAKVEMVQRRAARYVLNRFHNTSHVTDMLEELKWPTLKDRRMNYRLTMLYKIRNGLVATTGRGHLTPITSMSRHHNSCAYQIHSGPAYYTNSFYQRTIREWNKLPDAVVGARSLEIFKTSLLAAQQTN